MKYAVVILLSFILASCQALNESGSLTEAAIKQIKLSHKNKKLNDELKKATAKSAEIIAAEKMRDENLQSPEKWYDLGMLYWEDYQKTERKFSHDKAEEAFASLLKMVPGNVVTIKALYNIYYRDIISGDADAFLLAQDYFNRLTPEHQKSLNPPSLAQYIYVYYQQKNSGKIDYPLLHKTLLQAIQEQPNAEISYIQLAKIYSNQSYYPLAIATLKLGSEQNPASVELMKAIASTYEARASADSCHYENGLLIDKASQYYLRAVPLQSDLAELHLKLARLFMDRHLFNLSAYETQLLLSLKPSAANYAFAAHNYALMGKKEMANRYLESAKTEGLLASDSAYHEVYMISGEWLKAALSFTDYIQSKKRLHVYDAIKADIISQQSGMKLSSLVAKKQIAYANDWQTLVYAWWQGDITEEKLASVAANKCERAELYFYSGYKSMQAGNMLAAKSAFNKTIEQNTYRFIERPLAKGFLANIK